jgi:hypothetical protein
MTASATAPPTPHNKLSRLPSIHRLTLEGRTDSEYAQRQKKITKHFFGVKLHACYNFEEEQQREASTQARGLRCCVSRP